MRDTVDILGVRVDRVSMDEAAERARGYLSGGAARVIYTPNPEIIMHACRNPDFADVLNRADMVVPDGIGVVYAAKILKKPLKERVAGFDLVCRMLRHAAENGVPVYLFGGRKGVAEEAAARLKREYAGLKIVGTAHGYLKDTAPVAAEIRKRGARLVLVCLGAPHQELWIDNNKESTGASLLIGAGGSIDVLAGRCRRAPDIYRRLNLEWLYRLMKQPSRFVRMLDLPVFAINVLLKGKRQNNIETG